MLTIEEILPDPAKVLTQKEIDEACEIKDLEKLVKWVEENREKIDHSIRHIEYVKTKLSSNELQQMCISSAVRDKGGSGFALLFAPKNYHTKLSLLSAEDKTNLKIFRTLLFLHDYIKNNKANSEIYKINWQGFYTALQNSLKEISHLPPSSLAPLLTDIVKINKAKKSNDSLFTLFNLTSDLPPSISPALPPNLASICNQYLERAITPELQDLALLYMAIKNSKINLPLSWSTEVLYELDSAIITRLQKLNLLPNETDPEMEQVNRLANILNRTYNAYFIKPKERFRFFSEEIFPLLELRKKVDPTPTEKLILNFAISLLSSQLQYPYERIKRKLYEIRQALVNNPEVTEISQLPRAIQNNIQEIQKYYKLHRVTYLDAEFIERLAEGDRTSPNSLFVEHIIGGEIFQAAALAPQVKIEQWEQQRAYNDDLSTFWPELIKGCCYGLMIATVLAIKGSAGLPPIVGLIVVLACFAIVIKCAKTIHQREVEGMLDQKQLYKFYAEKLQESESATLEEERQMLLG